MGNEYVSSDAHYNHDNIVSHCARPCLVSENNVWISSIINDPLSDDDTMWHLGDFACGKHTKYNDIKALIDGLNGSWKFIIGNHDNKERLRRACQGTRHEVMGEYVSFRKNGKKIVMLHYPMERWDSMHYGSIHLHGHVHNNTVAKIDNRYNVCLDYEHKIYKLNDFLKEV